MATQAKPQEQTPVETLSFEAALRELESIVSRLEQGEVDLEDSIALYERGQALKNHCEAKLKAAEGRLEKIVLVTAGARRSRHLKNNARQNGRNGLNHGPPKEGSPPGRRAFPRRSAQAAPVQAPGL